MTEFLKGLLLSSVSGAVLTALLFLAKPFVKNRLSKRSRYFCWQLVLLRMLLPFSIGVFSVGGLPALPRSPVPSAPAGGVSAAAQPAASAASAAGATASVSSPSAALNTPRAADAAPPAQSGGLLTRNWQALLFAVWLLGVTAMLGISAAGYLRYARKLNAGRIPVEDGDILALYRECGENYGIRRPPALYVGSPTDTPMLCGVFRRSIILPERKLTSEQLRYAFLHELAHARRRDNLLKRAAVFASAVNWFNPAVYFAAREAGRLCELSCDEIVTAGFSREERIAYGRTLLAVAADSVREPFALSATMSEDKRSLKERLKMLAKPKKPSRKTGILSVSAALVAVAAAAFTLTVSDAKTPVPPISGTGAPPAADSTDTESGTAVDLSLYPEITEANASPVVLGSVNEAWKEACADMVITSEWVSETGQDGVKAIVLLGSLKSDPRQGAAEYLTVDTQSGNLTGEKKFQSPEKHGALTVSRDETADNRLTVTDENGGTLRLELPFGFVKSAVPEITDRIGSDLQKEYSDITIKNEWITEHGDAVLFGSLKSDPQQGVAVAVSGGADAKRCDTPGKHGAIEAQSLSDSSTYDSPRVSVTAADGRRMEFDYYDGFFDNSTIERYSDGLSSGDSLTIPVADPGIRAEITNGDTEPAAIAGVNAAWGKLYPELDITAEWLGPQNSRSRVAVLFGSLKSEPRQGVAQVLFTTGSGDGITNYKRYLTPSYHGALKISVPQGVRDDTMLVKDEQGQELSFHLYNGFE